MSTISTGNRSVNAGAGGNINVDNGVINLGEISGQVKNEINQLRDKPSSNEQLSLKEILAQLQDAIENDEELSEGEKEEALQAVSRIAHASKESNPNEKTQGMIKRATNTIKGIMETLSNTSKFVQTSQNLLPKLLQFFGL